VTRGNCGNAAVYGTKRTDTALWAEIIEEAGDGAGLFCCHGLMAREAEFLSADEFSDR
jgi:hypothetical protein